MKTVLRNSFVAFLALLILATGGGISITRMVCGISGEVSYGFGDMAACYPVKDLKGTHVSPKQCDYSKSEVKPVKHTSSVKASAAPGHAATSPLPVFSPFVLFLPELSPGQSSGADPPLSGRLILRLISILVI